MSFLLFLLLVSPATDSARERLDQAAELLRQRAPVEALGLLEPLLVEAESAGDAELLMEVRHQTATAFRQRGDYPKALESDRRALELSRSLGRRSFEARILRNLAVTLKSKGDYPEGLARGEESLALHEALGEKEGAGRAAMTLGALHDLRGEYRLALQRYGQAEAALQDSQGRDFFTLLGEMAITYKNLGEYPQALAHYDRALEGLRRSGDKYGEMNTLLNAGNVYGILGDFERAVEQYERSLSMARALNERRAQGFLLGNLGWAWLGLNEPAKALPYGRQALELARAVGNRNGEAVALEGLGDAALALDDLAQAREHYEQALAIQREIGARAFAGNVLVSLAEVSVRANDLAGAARLAAEALAVARETENPEMEWRAQHLLARVARGEGRKEEALGLLRASIEVISGLRGRIRTDAGKIGYLETRQAVFHETVDLLVAAGRQEEALEAAEAARSRAFVDLLAERKITAAPSDASALAGIREDEVRLRAQSRMKPPGDAGRAELTRTRAATATAIGERLQALRSARPELASLVVADAPSFAQMAQIGRRLGATVVEYFVTEKRLFIFVIDARGEVASRAVDVTRSHLRQAVGDVHRMLNELDAAGLRDQRALRTGLAGLHRLLVAPIADRLPRDPLRLVYLIPHDALLRVPFAALLDGRGRPLLRQHTLAFAPSLDVLRYTADKKAEGAPRLLALADPGTGADALPGARTEVQRVSRHFPAGRRTVLLGADASEANGKRLGPGQSILHFAVHGLIDDAHPLDSALLLAEGGGEDGALRVAEAFGLRLHADLVVLSGCSTGLGKVTGDGILGLARAFLYAGTPSVVVSQWDVSDRATAFLMDRFYAGMQAGHGKARSLREAQIATRARFPHPALWAAFSLVGEP